jgi:MYXO-CTERM domain-containing protein
MIDAQSVLGHTPQSERNVFKLFTDMRDRYQCVPPSLPSQAQGSVFAPAGLAAVGRRRRRYQRT